ncbi:LysM domain-containing protein [Hydrogenispora ethanolica]|jgi:LysM repeat protein|uniref:LysM domain-containing protein n=1 Tax=Hydrogenispora ethanolica TaxID=1082276 RepID=A0A4R1RD42_HYDET|nr:LysM peptidoglycan-binding domain-containing protein [Hydrogenispora ethanolica]TCL63758.1 LysM domain-containing protein [Hydrogenispora ethanolica]
MSLNCQYDVLSYPFYLRDQSRRISLETVLPLPENVPRIQGVVGGDLLAEPPRFVVGEDQITVSGKLHPYLVYIGKTDEEMYRGAGDEELSDEERGNLRAPREFGIGWRDEEEPIFEETIQFPGLRPEMMVDVDTVAAGCVFEKEGEDRVVARSQIEIRIHVASQKNAGILTGVTCVPADRFQAGKEQLLVEEIVGMRRERLNVQAPLLLPNLKPGLARIVRHSVRPTGLAWEVNRGKIMVKGFLDTSLIYVGSDDDGRPTEIFTNEWARNAGNGLAFETALDLEGAEEGMTVIPRVQVVRAELERSSQRELRANVRLEVEVKVSRTLTREMVVEVTSPANEVLDFQKYLLEMEEPLGESSGEVDLDLMVNLPFGQPGMDRLLGWRGSPGAVTVEAGEGKVMLEGMLNLQLFYVAETADETRLVMAEWGSASGNELPLAGMIDFAGLKPGALLRSYLSLENLNLEMTSERTLRLTGALRVRALGRTPRAIMVLRDCALVPPVDPATRPSMLFYVVQPGDTLWKIARRYQTTVEALSRSNQVMNPESLESGQKLLIPKHPMAAAQ